MLDRDRRRCATGSTSEERYIDADVRFHLAVADATGNRCRAAHDAGAPRAAPPRARPVYQIPGSAAALARAARRSSTRSPPATPARGAPAHAGAPAARRARDRAHDGRSSTSSTVAGRDQRLIDGHASASSGSASMGGGIARRLLAAGHQVHGYNRTPEQGRRRSSSGGMSLGRHAARGGRAAGDVVFSMVTNDAALRAVAEGPDGILAGLGARQGLRRHEHGQPGGEPRAAAETRRASGRGHARRARLGQRRSTLEQGKLSVMVGGDDDDVRARRADPARHRADRSRTSATTARPC